jgi:hypothetical protein
MRRQPKKYRWEHPDQTSYFHVVALVDLADEFVSGRSIEILEKVLMILEA